MDRTASDLKLLETITHVAKGNSATPAVSFKNHKAHAAANTHEALRDGMLFKALEPGCFLAGRWLG